MSGTRRVAIPVLLAATGLAALTAGCVATGPAGPGPESRLPAYACLRIDRDLVLSGKADDPLWTRAEVVQLGEPIDGRPNRYRTAARLLYNERYLYIAFDGEDEYVWGTLDERDAPIYEQECVEAFLCPSGKVRQYYEINVSPRNAVFDAVILNGRSAPDGAGSFNGLSQYTCEGLVTKVHVRGELGVRGAKGWSAEFAIPFASIPGANNLVPRPGDAWRFNLYRIDSPEPPALEFYAWSPTGANDYHRPWRFGVLEFR